MNGQTLTADKLVSQIDTIQRALDELKSQINSLVPPKYGSDAWWEESDRKALEDIKAGRYKSFKNVKALMKELKN